MKFTPKFYKGEKECPFEEGSMEWLFWRLERDSMGISETRWEEFKEEFLDALKHGDVWAPFYKDDNHTIEERTACYVMIQRYAKFCPYDADDKDWGRYFKTNA